MTDPSCHCQKCACKNSGQSKGKKRQREATPGPAKKRPKEAAPPGEASGGLWTVEDLGPGYEINPVETSKDKIQQPALAMDERKIIPPLGSSVIISGKSGSGKSTLLQNLLIDPRFYGKCQEKPEGWFTKKFLFAPTGASDDILKALDIPEKHVFTELDEAPAFLKVIQDSQGRKLKGGKKAHSVDQICVIFEDVIGETTFMNSREFRKMFYMVRHLNCTTFICAQHFNRVPRMCRLQASYIAFFAGSASEVEIIADMFAPPLYNKKEFIELVNDATRGDFSFLGICMKVGWKYRFRRNLNEFYSLPRLMEAENENDPKKPKKTEKRKEPEPPPEKDFSAEKLKESLKKVQQLKKERDVRLNEQATTVSRQWAYQGPRGRTIW